MSPVVYRWVDQWRLVRAPWGPIWRRLYRSTDGGLFLMTRPGPQ